MSNKDEEYSKSVRLLEQIWSAEAPESVTSLALSPKGKVIAVASVEEEIVVLDADTGAEKWKLAGHGGGTNAVEFLDGARLVSVGEDGEAAIWSLAKAAAEHRLKVEGLDADRTPDGTSVSTLSVSPSRRHFAVASGRSVTRFELGKTASDRPSAKRLPDLDHTTNEVRYARNGDLLASAHGGVTRFSFLADGESVRALPLPYGGTCLCAGVDVTGDYTVAGCGDQSLHIWHAKSRTDEGADLQEMSCGGYSGKVVAVEFDGKGDRCASAGGPQTVVWDFAGSPNGSMPTLLFGHSEAVTCLAWRPRGDVALQELIATGSKDGDVALFDLEDAVPGGSGEPDMCEIVSAADGGGDPVVAVLWAPDGLAIYSGHLSGAVRKWAVPARIEPGPGDDADGSSDGDSSEDDEEDDGDEDEEAGDGGAGDKEAAEKA